MNINEISSWVIPLTMLCSRACENGPWPISCKRIAKYNAVSSSFDMFIFESQHTNCFRHKMHA